MSAGLVLAAAVGEVLGEWRRTGWWPPPHAEAVMAENAWLTAALHANHCHPGFEYAITAGGSPVPPGAHMWGTGWEPNPESPGHGRGSRPRDTRWVWRRPRQPNPAPPYDPLTGSLSDEPTLPKVAALAPHRTDTL